MWRIVALCWVFTAPALAGALVIAVLATPQLAAEAGLWIPIAALLGALYGVPAARCIARFVEAPCGAARRRAALGLGPLGSRRAAAATVGRAPSPPREFLTRVKNPPHASVPTLALEQCKGGVSHVEGRCAILGHHRAGRWPAFSSWRRC